MLWGEKRRSETEALDHLVQLDRLDTLYRDLYLDRARYFLQGVLSYESYLDLKREQNTLANIPNQIRNALAGNNWLRVRELSKQHDVLKEEIDRKAPLTEAAKAVYEAEGVMIDPFSPGMNTIPGVTRQSLDTLCNEAQRHLEQLGRADPDLRDFYARRREAFARLATTADTASDVAHAMSGQPEREALEALEEGNFGQLERLAEAMSDTKALETPSWGNGLSPEDDEPPAYEYAFDSNTLSRATKLGLVALRVPSRHREFAPLCRFAWHPTFAQIQGNQSGVLRVPDLPFPEGTPDALKTRVQLFATHPMINSGGIRFLPSLVDEDVLVETFDEPTSGADSPRSELLELLGLSHRNQLSRRKIEAALLTHGAKVLKNELGLDPSLFKLVCIPPDLHMRIGLERGWGQEKIWTHFDGYLVMMDGALHPLAGGDVRFGGIYDLLGLPRDYAPDRVIVRFAVVQRRRMALWQ